MKNSGAWVDEDDLAVSVDLSKNSRLKSLKQSPSEQFIDGNEYAARLRERHELLHSRPKWAAVSEESETVDSILSRPFDLASESASTQLLPDVIQVQRVLNANHQEVCREPVIGSQFHPSAPIAMVASRGPWIRFFTIDDKENPLLHKVELTGLKPTCVLLSPDGNYVMATGKSRFIYIYNVLEDRMEKINNVPERNEREWSKFCFSPKSDIVALQGENGFIVLLSSVTKRCVGTLKMNGNVKATAFTPDGRFLLSAGADHQVYVWDMTTKKCVRKFSDDSGSAITSLSVSPDSNYLIVGSLLGVVNIYNFRTVMEESTPTSKPWKTLMNLTTAIDQIVWHPSCELAAISTDGAVNGLRLVHLPSGRVYSNWPNIQMPLGLVKSVSFSTDGALLSIGCGDGKVRMFALKHYRK